MGRLIWGFGLFVLLVASFPPAARADDREDCQSPDNDVRISGCSAIIDGGKEEGIVEAYYNRGVAYKRKGEYDHAIKDLNAAIAMDPKYVAAYLTRGDAYEKKGGNARAMSDYDMAIMLDPKDADPYNYRCWLRAIQGLDLGAARADCDTAIQLKNDDSNSLDSRGLVGIKQEKFAYAWADYDAAVRAKPDMASALYGRGIAALRLGRLADGKADLARAAELDPNIAKTYLGYGVAPDAVNTNIDTAPASTFQSHYDSGSNHLEKKEYDLAIKEYGQAIALDPKSADAYNVRCWTRALQGLDLDAARADCDQALALSPGEARILDSRGLVGIKQEKFYDALADYDAAVRAGLQSFPEDLVIASFFYGRGVAALRLGRLAEGNADLAKATGLDPNIAKTYAGYGVTP